MKKTMALVVGMMMAASLAGCGAKNESKTVDDIKKAGKLVMATDAAWAPFEYIADTETPVG